MSFVWNANTEVGVWIYFHLISVRQNRRIFRLKPSYMTILNAVRDVRVDTKLIHNQLQANVHFFAISSPIIVFLFSNNC